MTQSTSVYIGTVFPLAGKDPVFRYERQVSERDGALVSTHITRALDGAVAIGESALHDADYRLQRYTLHKNQRDQRGTIVIEGERVLFHRTDGEREHRRSERHRTPVVVGPTLVGHIVRNLGVLAAGNRLQVRLAVLDRLETIGFTLRAEGSDPAQTTVVMRPSNFLVAWLIDPVRFTFETATGKLLRLEGRVPPKIRSGARWRELDARVEYQFLAESYR